MKYLRLIYDEEKTWAAMGGFRLALRYVGRVPPSTEADRYAVRLASTGSSRRFATRHAQADPPEILLSASALRGARLG